MKYRVARAAQAEALDALGWYDAQSAGLGNDFIDEVHHAYGELGAHPRACSLVEGYVGRHELRWIRLRRFPYLVVFQVLATEVVVAVQHEHRRPLNWVGRLQDLE